MSETFWLIFWGVVATLLGIIVALLVNGLWWVGALIGLVVYLIILAFIYSGGDGPTIIFFDFD